MVRKSVKNKPLSFRERGFKIAQLLFDNPVEFKSESKAKKCVVGYPCSSTCISTKKNCRNKLATGGEPYNFAKWVTTHLSLGKSLSKEQMTQADSLYNQKLSGLKPKETPAPATQPPAAPQKPTTETKPTETKTEEQPETPQILAEKKSKAIAEVKNQLTEAEKELSVLSQRYQDSHKKLNEIQSEINNYQYSWLYKHGSKHGIYKDAGKQAIHSALMRHRDKYPEYQQILDKQKSVFDQIGNSSKEGTIEYDIDQSKRKIRDLSQQIKTLENQPLEKFGKAGQKVESAYTEADLRKPLNAEETKQLSTLIDGKFNDARRYFAVGSKEGKPNELLDKFLSSDENKKLGLSREEAASLFSYTANGYVGMSAATRMQFKDESTDIAKDAVLMSRAMNQALDKLPSYKDSTVYRGTKLPYELIKEYIPGAIVPLRGFTSTTTNEKVVDEYLRGQKTADLTPSQKAYYYQTKQALPAVKTKQGEFAGLANEFGLKKEVTVSGKAPGFIKYTIQSKSGKLLGKASSTPSDYEVLFKSNTKFEVLESKYNKEKGYHEVSLREV